MPEDPTPSPEEQIGALFQMQTDFEPAAAALTGMRQQLISGGWTEQGAEAIVLATFQASLRSGAS
jgi:hypothetical protein